MVRGPYDLSLVEGSITTAHDAERIREVRRVSKALVTIGACATAGGIQALRNFKDVNEFIVASSTPGPNTSRRWRTSTPIAEHVQVDFELRGCPIDKRQLLEVIARVHARRKPDDARAQRLHRVQAARQGVRDGGARNAMSGAGHACRLRRDLPGLRSRLLRLLRADGNAQHRRRSPRACSELGASNAALMRVLPHLQRRCAAAFREGERGAWRHETRTIKVDYLARVEGEGALHVRFKGDRSRTCELTHLRAAALLRGVPARPRLRRSRPTSPRASAASARSPTR